jgi:hypothetical protein
MPSKSGWIFMPNKLIFCHLLTRLCIFKADIQCLSSLFKKAVIAFCMLSLGMISRLVSAEDTLQTVMVRMKPSSAVTINYQETRYLSLMTDKWTGSGSFYALLPDTMIKEQRLPTRELMAIKGGQMYYLNQESGQKHQGELSVDDNSTAHIEVFKGLINGNIEALKSRFTIDFVSHSSGWTITLSPLKQTPSESTFKIIMQGLPEQAAKRLEIIMPDGDRSEFLIRQADSGEASKTSALKSLDLLGAN